MNTTSQGAPAAPLWSERHERGSRHQARRQADGAPAKRDVASMNAEIAHLQTETTQSLDRTIAAAEASLQVGTRVTETLHEQRQQMGQIDREARNIDSDLKRTGYNLKHGFTWRGALTSPFRRASKVPQGSAVARGNKMDISPVYRDGYSGKTSGSPKGGSGTSRTTGPAAAGVSENRAAKSGGLFSRKKTAAADAKAADASANRAKLPREHVPDGFEKQLDTLDGLLDGLAQQADAIGTELRQQNEGIEELGARVEPIRAETASQAQQIKRRFRVQAR